MDRSSFLKVCGVLGIGLPFQSLISSCDKRLINASGFKGKVLIIGAGAGGLSAGYLLSQLGLDFKILEASSETGGRMKINRDFADFPVSLGAEWIEGEKEVLDEIINDPSVKAELELIKDDPDFKFVNYSWFNFFEDYILPSVKSQIQFNRQVNSIDYSGNKLVVSSSGELYFADRVILSVPLKILQEGGISFTPALPQNKSDAIHKAVVWDGFKAFFQFSEQFYGEGHAFEIRPKEAGQKIYYDASLGHDTSRYVLGLFSVGEPAKIFSRLSSEDLKKFVLKELDELFDSRASLTYINHIVQNWQTEPHIKAGYLSDHEDWRLVRELGKHIDHKIYFAGGEFTDGEDWVSVHTAAQAARRVVWEMLS